MWYRGKRTSRCSTCDGGKARHTVRPFHFVRVVVKRLPTVTYHHLRKIVPPLSAPATVEPAPPSDEGTGFCSSTSSNTAGFAAPNACQLLTRTSSASARRVRVGCNGTPCSAPPTPPDALRAEDSRSTTWTIFPDFRAHI